MANLLELTARYGCDDCGDEFTVDYQDVSEVEDEVEHEECPAFDCDECGCNCEDCDCVDNECNECGCDLREGSEEDAE